MVIANLSGARVTYPNETVSTISFHKAIEVLNPDDCAGNGISPTAVVMTIALKDGNIATFEALNWAIIEV